MLVAIGITISIGEAVEQLLFGERVGGVFCSAGEIGDSGGINDRDVIGACDGDVEGVIGGFKAAVGCAVVDLDDLLDTLGETLVGGIGGIECPRAVGVDG